MWLIPKYWMETSPKSNWMRAFLGITYCFHTEITACWYNRGKTRVWGRCESTGIRGLGRHQEPPGPGKSLLQGQEDRSGCVGSLCLSRAARPALCQAAMVCHAPGAPRCFSAFSSARLSLLSPIPELTFDTWSCQSHRALPAAAAEPQLIPSAAYPNGRRKRLSNLQTWHTAISPTPPMCSARLFQPTLRLGSSAEQLILNSSIFSQPLNNSPGTAELLLHSLIHCLLHCLLHSLQSSSFFPHFTLIFYSKNYTRLRFPRSAQLNMQKWLKLAGLLLKANLRQSWGRWSHLVLVS